MILMEVKKEVRVAQTRSANLLQIGLVSSLDVNVDKRIKSSPIRLFCKHGYKPK